MPKRAKRSFVGIHPRVPPPYPSDENSLQVNCCKKVGCKNFGVWPSTDYSNPYAGARYRKASGSGGAIGLQCLECNISFPMKSNQGIIEELERISSYLYQEVPVRGCPIETCPNYTVDVSAGSKYFISWGKTRSGSKRYQCKECKRHGHKKIFSVNERPTFRQKKPGKNEQIFLALVNKSVYNRMFEAVKTGPGTVYGKIDFFYRQCRAFAAYQERKLLEKSRLGFRRLYLSTDAQVYSVNWRIHDRAQAVKLTAVGTADNWSGFVFAMNLNFDPDKNKHEIEKETVEKNDYRKMPPFRRHARYWLEQDYLDAIEHLKKKLEKTSKKKPEEKRIATSLLERILLTAYESQDRWNVDDTDVMTWDFKLPEKGMQVHRDYVYYAHYLFLHRLFADNFGKLRFFFDYDSGLRSACLTAFREEIKAHRVDACYVSVLYKFKGYPHSVRKGFWKKEYSKIKDRYPFMRENKIRTLMMIRQMKAAQRDDTWKDWWVHHPDPDMNEPEKMLSFQTYYEGLRPRHLARLYLKGSLHGINHFFNFVRRRLNPLERPLDSASAEAGNFYIYGPYNPAIVVKLLEILRVYWNYVFPVKEHQEHTSLMKKLVWEGKAKRNKDDRYQVPVKKRKTRAMYLGLTDRPYGIEEILNLKTPREIP